MMLKKRIPTIFGILILLIGITAGVYLVEFGPQSFSTRAGPEATPKDVHITNIGDSSFSVSWQTDASVIGFIKYSTSPGSFNLSTLDDREELNGGNREFLTHHVTVSDLNPETTYYFVIVSGTESSTFDNQGQPYSVTTGPELTIESVVDAAYGSIYYSDLSSAEGVLVYVTIEGSSELSSITGSSGTWAVPLSTLRSKDLSSFYEYDKENASISIEAITSDDSRSSVTTTTANDTPVDDIVIGKSYDFSEEIADEEETQATESGFFTEPLEEDVENQVSSVTIDNIGEGESINTQQPEFIGSGPAGTTIDLILESDDPIETSINVDEKGNWSWTPSSLIEAGKHTITLKWVDENGLARTMTRTFTVFAQGESDLPSFESTPSATPTLEASPTPTTTIAIIPTSSPTATPSPTSTPTPRLSPTSTPSVATDPALPTPGTGFVSMLMIISGLTITVIGAGFLLLKQSSLK